MNYKLKVDFPSNTNHSHAVTGLGVLQSEFEDKQDHLIFDHELSLDEEMMIRDFGGIVQKCK